MVGIEIHVLHVVTEEDLDRLEIGGTIELNEKHAEKYTLYTVDYTKPLDETKCIISTAGLDFIINESYESINARLRDRIIHLLN